MHRLGIFVLFCVRLIVLLFAQLCNENNIWFSSYHCKEDKLISELHNVLYQRFDFVTYLPRKYFDPNCPSQSDSYVVCLALLTLGRTSKVTPIPWYRGGGRWWTPLGFRYVTIFWKDSTFIRKPVMCSTRWGTYYGLPRCWVAVTSFKMAAILGAILDFTKN